MVIMDFSSLIQLPLTKRSFTVINSCKSQSGKSKFLLTYINISRCPSTNPVLPYSASYKIWYNISRNKLNFVLKFLFVLILMYRGIKIRNYVRHPNKQENWINRIEVISRIMPPSRIKSGCRGISQELSQHINLKIYRRNFLRLASKFLKILCRNEFLPQI